MRKPLVISVCKGATAGAVYTENEAHVWYVSYPAEGSCRYVYTGRVLSYLDSATVGVAILTLLFRYSKVNQIIMLSTFILGFPGLNDSRDTYWDNSGFP